MLAPLWFIVCLLSDAAAEPYIGLPYNMRGWGILASSGNQLLAPPPPPAPAVPAPAPAVPAVPAAVPAVPAIPVAAAPAAVPPTVYVYCTLELQTKVPEDYAKIYNHGVEKTPKGHNYHKGRATLRIYVNQTRPSLNDL